MGAGCKLTTSNQARPVLPVGPMPPGLLTPCMNGCMFFRDPPPIGPFLPPIPAPTTPKINEVTVGDWPKSYANKTNVIRADRPTFNCDDRCTVQDGQTKQHCDIPNYGGVDQTECEAKGCCWERVYPNPNEEPWCYAHISLESDDEVAPVTILSDMSTTHFWMLIALTFSLGACIGALIMWPILTTCKRSAEYSRVAVVSEAEPERVPMRNMD